MSPINEKDQKAAEKKAPVQRPSQDQAQRGDPTRRQSDAETLEATRTASTSTSTPEDRRNKDVENSGAVSDEGGLGVIVPNAARVEGEGIPVTDGGSLDLAPRNDDEKRARQELIIPDDPDLYPVIKTVNDPADNAPLVDEYAEQQRVMEARRQMGFANRDEGTPVTEREQRRRMAEGV